MANLVDFMSDLTIDDIWFPELLGQIVFAYRIKSGLNQSELATLACVSDKTIHRIEGGSSTDTASLNNVFDSLNITPKDIGEALIELSKS